MTDLCACGCGEHVPPPFKRRGTHPRKYVDIAHRERAAYLRRVPTYAAKRKAYKPRLENTSTASDGKCVVEMGVRVVSEQNTHTHWRVLANRTKMQKQAVTFLLKIAREHVDSKSVKRVTFQRCGGRKLDSDNLVGAFKHVRDAVAVWLGADDGPDGGIRWVVDQNQDTAAAQGIRITFE